MKKISAKLLASLAFLAVAVSIPISFAYASWQFNDSDSSTGNINAGVTKWDFGAPHSIVIDGNSVKIDGQTVSSDVISYPGGTPDYGGGQVSMEIELVDGDLVVTNYAATSIASGAFSLNSTLIFPGSVSVNGVEYPIIAIGSPTSIQVNRLLLNRTVSVVVPEGYVSICDNAFNNISREGGLTGSTTINFSIPSTLEYLGYHAFNYGVNGVGISISYTGTTTQFKNLVTNSAATYGTGYSFFSGATGNISVTCSNGTVVYNPYGNYVSG